MALIPPSSPKIPPAELMTGVKPLPPEKPVVEEEEEDEDDPELLPAPQPVRAMRRMGTIRPKVMVLEFMAGSIAI